MRKCVELSLTDFFIIDHALRDYVKRPEAETKDLDKENDLLDRINTEIKNIRKMEKEGLR